MSDGTAGVVVVGGSIAGLTTVQELRRGGYTGTITVVDRDHQAPYRRPDVSKALLQGPAGERTMLAWDEALAATVLAPAAASAVNLDERVVTVQTSDSGALSLPYRELVIATGAVARPAPFDYESDRVHSLRGIADAERFRHDLQGSHRVVVIGGGLIGLEVAAGLAAQGKKTTVIELESKPLQRILGSLVADRLVSMLSERGVRFRLGVFVTDIANTGPSTAVVRMSDASTVEADVVLVSVGARPATDWLGQTGLDLSDGIQCDEHGAVLGSAAVFAVGDVANWPNRTLGRRGRVEHWNNAIEQAVHVAKRIVGADTGDGFRSVPYFWSDQADLKLQVLGSTLGHDDVRIVREDENSFVVEYRRDGRLVAVGGVNAGRDVMTRRAELIAEFERTQAGAGTPSRGRQE